ncbi:MAG: methyltransferase domain-containing protein [Myxococcota bacterium]
MRPVPRHAHALAHLRDHRRRARGGRRLEQKTPEWLAQIGCPDLWRPIEAPEGLTPLLLAAWEEREPLAARIRTHVAGLQARAEAQLDQLAALARGEALPTVSPRRVARGDWREETWRYDRPHRRLKLVADLVLAESSGGRVLDVGCSSGLLGRMLGARYDYTGLDVAPSVAADEPRFRIRTAQLDGEWPLALGQGGTPLPFDVVTASGALEYAEDLVVTLGRLRMLLRPKGLAVVTLFNLAHTSRGPRASRHPTWRFETRPDELLLHLREVGLVPMRVLASSAGHGPAPAVDAEVPTDLDRAGAAQVPVPALFQLAHHVVVVCRAGAPAAGPAEIERRYLAGDVAGALKAAVGQLKEAPWSARAWADLGALWMAAGDVQQAQRALERALALDPTRPGVAEDLAVVAEAEGPSAGT